MTRSILFILAMSLAALTLPAAAEVPVPAATEAALAYQHDLDLFWAASQILGLAIPALLLATGWAARIRTVCARLSGGRWLFTLALFAIALSVIQGVLTAPLDYAQGFVHEHAFGLSNQDFGRWLQNELIGMAVGSVLLALVVWIPYLLIRHSPRFWFLWSTLGIAPVFVLLMIVAPIWIAPLFNHFEPLTDKALEARVAAEAARGGITGAAIFQMDQSADSKRPGAYVAGLGGTQRIVLYDTLIQTMTPDEIAFVVGHEMKHYLMDDVWKLVGLYLAVLLAGLFVTDLLARAALRRWSGRFGFTSIADPASLPLLLGLVSLVFLVATPGLNWATRQIEHEADRFGLELTQNNDAAATAFVKLQSEGLGVPDPDWFQRLFRLDHPSLRDRIDFANRYHPWLDGTKLIYGDHIGAAGH